MIGDFYVPENWAAGSSPLNSTCELLVIISNFDSVWAQIGRLRGYLTPLREMAWVWYLILYYRLHWFQQRNNGTLSIPQAHATLFWKWSQKTENSCFFDARYCDEGNGGRPSTAGRLTATYNESVSGKTLNFKITAFFTTSVLLKTNVPATTLSTTF
jgi:hypothetical protein